MLPIPRSVSVNPSSVTSSSSVTSQPGIQRGQGPSPRGEGVSNDRRSRLLKAQKTSIFSRVTKTQKNVTSPARDRGAPRPEKAGEIHAVDDLGNTLLHCMVRRGDLGFVKSLLAFPDVKLDLGNKNGETLLHLAVSQPSLEDQVAVDLTKLLLEKGANPNLANDYGETPLHIGICDQRLAIVQALLEKGAHVDLETPEGATPLYIAVVVGNIDIIALLLEKGADPNAKTQGMRSPLELATLLDHRHIVDLFFGKKE